MGVTILELGADGWNETRVVAGTIALPEIDIELPLDEVYRGVRFPPVAST